MNNGSRIQSSAELLADLTKELQDLCSDFETEPQGLHTKYLGLFLVYTIRQVQAICILINNPAPFYAEQAGQLLRGLCELYAKAAWMMYPEAEGDRDYRAWRLEKSSVAKEPLSAGQRKKLYSLAGIDKYEGEYSILKPIPSTRKMLLGIGASDVYDFFQWESSAIHISLTTLSTTVHRLDTETGRVMVGGPNHPVDRGKRLWVALDMFGRIADLIIMGFGIDLQDWVDIQATKVAEIAGLLAPLAEAEVTT